VIELGTATGSCQVSSRGASLSVLQTVQVRYERVRLKNEKGFLMTALVP